jgi:AmmeMemoRadiSam system protein A
MTPDPFSLTDDDRMRLLRVARRSLAARVRGEQTPEPERGGGLDLRLGAFVTIHRADELRGCLGRLERDAPLARTISHLARAVVDSDPRFDPVTHEELTAIAIEISVLTPEREIVDAAEIEVGRHGLIAERGRRRGLLLPQVPVEHGWDRVAFLEHTCVKAGLSRDAWRSDVRLFVFEADVFAETPSDPAPTKG